MYTLLRTDRFSKWLHRLKDRETKARLLASIDAMRKTGHAGDFKPVGGGVYEGRFHFGPGYRVYYAHEDDKVVLLLFGGTKSSQRADIALAKGCIPSADGRLFVEHVAEWDVAEFLEDEETMAAYLNAVIDNGEPSDITKALGDIARAKGMTKVARETGFTRDGLYKALSAAGNPSIALVSEVLASLGLKLRVAAL